MKTNFAIQVSSRQTRCRCADILIALVMVTLAACLGSVDCIANDFKPIDLGNTDQVRNNNVYKALPQKERDYYENGDPTYNHDGIGGHDKNGNGKRDEGEDPFDRADFAAYCVRYQRGKALLRKTPPAPATEKDFLTIMESVKTCVDDYVEPDENPQDNKVFFTDDAIADLINKKLMGIGLPMTVQKFKDYGDPKRTGFFCIEHAMFFASLARELGFPARELNVPLSKMQDKKRVYFYQEASTEVFFNGKWYYFDAYETKPGNAAKVERTPDGWPGFNSTITDRTVHFRSKPFDEGEWYFGKSGYDPDNGDPRDNWQKEDSNSDFKYLKVTSAAIFEQQAPGVRIFVTLQGTALRSGWTPDLFGDPVVPGNLDDLLLNSALTGAHLDIPGSAYLPQGVQIPGGEGLPSSDLSGQENDPIVTNDTVTLQNPATGQYCVNLWNQAEGSSDFVVFVSTEGGVNLGFPGEITGPPLAPGEVRQIACGTISQ